MGVFFCVLKHNHMLIRTHPYMNILYSTRQATLEELPAFSGTVVRELYKWVADLDLLVCGPQYWIYRGADGRPGTRFTLEVALPVQGNIPTAVLPHFKRIPAFRCLTSRYEGSWEGIGEEYSRMYTYIRENGLKLSGISAEAFLHVDFDNPANHITEIQI